MCTSYRKARIAYDLRKKGFQAVSKDNQSIPVEQAEIIIDKVKKAFPKKVTNKVIALHSLNIFETLNARPHPWYATVGLAGIHIGSIAVALIFIFVFTTTKMAP